MDPALSVDDLFELLDASAALDDGEAVDLRTHGLQCAYLLSRVAPGDRELQVAGLVHDVYHAVDPTADSMHDREGARLIEPLLGARVARLVGGHVVAKRYLVSTDAGYRDLLSARSVETLARQGDELDAASRRAVEASPDRDAMLTLRRADDRAKDPGAVVPPLAHWRPLLEELASAAGSGNRASAAGSGNRASAAGSGNSARG